MIIRSSGILLHLTCLPSRFGIGDMGTWAYKFADFLEQAGQSYWQMIPLTPPNLQHFSPYHSPSAFAGNSLLISPELLLADGLLDESDVRSMPSFPDDRVDFPGVMKFKFPLLKKASEKFLVQRAEEPLFNLFCRANAKWLDDYALFTALSTRFHGKPWNEWPPEFRDREPETMAMASQDLSESILKEKVLQYLFSKQWAELKNYCNQKKIQIIGDLPVYVDGNSADTWTYPEFFKLDHMKKPYVVAGVPPDYFSATGQLWGHPVYDWTALKKAEYSWWLDRIEHNLKQSDLLRIDHFRGFAGYWEVPATETTALNGKWQPGPGKDFFKVLLKRFPQLPIIAEDLGYITPDVIQLMDEFGFPGMKLLLFAFGENLPSSPYAPHNLTRNCIVFTGTHDNNTVKGWLTEEASEEDKARFFHYIGHKMDESRVPWEMCRLAMMTVADLAILPMQDILGLGSEARMNLPSRKEDNWRWRVRPELVTSDTADRLRELTELYGRA